MNHLNHWKCLRVLHFKCQQKVIQKVRPLYNWPYAKSVNQQFWRSIWADFSRECLEIFSTLKNSSPKQLLRVQLQNNRNFQLDPHMKIQKNTRDLCVVWFGGFFFLVFVFAET